MAKKKQEQQEQSQDEHVMAVLDKRTNKTAVISKMNEQDGSIEVVPPDKKNNNSFLKLDRTTDVYKRQVVRTCFYPWIRKYG